MAKRKQISFDIDTSVAKQILGEQGYTKIYKDIRRFLEKCVREIHQTDVSNVHSLSRYFTYDGTSGKYERQEQKGDGHKREPFEKPSVRDKLEKNKAYVNAKEQGEFRDRSDHREVR